MSFLQYWSTRAHHFGHSKNILRYTPASLLYAFRHRMGLTVAPTVAAVQKEVIRPTEKQATRPTAYYLPGQLDRVMATEENSTFDLEHARIKGFATDHAATIAYRLDNVDFIHGVLYSHRSCWAQVHQRARPGIYPLDVELEEAALPTTLVGDQFFGHFVCDDAASTLLASKWGDVYYASSGNRSNWPHADEYLDIYGLKYPTLQTAHLHKAWVFEDFGMNAHRRQRLETLRSYIRSQGGEYTGHHVYIRRRGGGAPRTLSNEIALEERLESQGFIIVDPVKMTTEEVIAKTCNAALICSVEGSALAHGYLAAAPNAALLTIQPPYRFTNIWKDFCDASELRYGFIVGEGTSHEFTVSIDDVLRTVDLLSPGHSDSSCLTVPQSMLTHS